MTWEELERIDRVSDRIAEVTKQLWAIADELDRRGPPPAKEPAPRKLELVDAVQKRAA